MLQSQKSELTKQLILDKSFELFYENGFKTTSVDTIMKATKLTKGAFYHHYKSKKELGIAVIDLKLHKRLYDAMIAPLSANGNALDILENTFLNRMKSFPLHDKIHGCPVNNMVNEIGDYEETYQLALKKLMDEWKAELIKLIERGKREGSIRSDISSSSVAIYMMSAYEGVRGIRKIYSNDDVIDDYISGMTFYIHQIRN